MPSRAILAPARLRATPLRVALLAVLLLLLHCRSAPMLGDELEWPPRGPMRFGVGDRLTVFVHGEWRSVAKEARRVEVPLDYLEIWLPRGWKESWLSRRELEGLAAQGTTPVFVHYFFGDAMSRERVQNERDEWHASLRRLGRAVRDLPAALVVLEPEFNDAPVAGETSTTEWAGFGDAMGEAAEIVRREAPNARIGVCAGDFYPTLDLDSLEDAMPALDFIAFQEMRAVTTPVKPLQESGVGARSLRYAKYLQARFGKPILLAYVAVSSHGGWQQRQAGALRDLARVRDELEATGVFGMIYFQLFDDPLHTGYFGEAEREFGLLTPGGRPKPALAEFLALTRGAPSARASRD